ncbi:hypothetical protein DBA29_27020 [Xenophilus aerolatus]|nr:hypothetical protein [Xenophilus aerolatus]
MTEIRPHDANTFDVQPLGFEQFVRAAEGNPTFPVVITNGNSATESTGLEIAGPLTVSATMTGPPEILAYGLIDGGWLPMPWAHKRLALVDRNLVIKLEKALVNEAQLHGPAARFSLMKDLGLDSLEVSPALFALEGRNKRPPSPFEIRAELARGVRALEQTFAGAKVQRMTSIQRAALFNMGIDNAIARANAQRLLMKAAPLVVDQPPPHERLDLEREILQMADEERVPATAQVALALLSCVYDGHSPLSDHRAARPGRALIKPKREYTPGMAYNAAADMFALEALHHMHSILPQLDPVLYTDDIGMAAFWIATQPSARTSIGKPNGKVQTMATFPLRKGLFPALDEEGISALHRRLHHR